MYCLVQGPKYWAENQDHDLDYDGTTIVLILHISFKTVTLVVNLRGEGHSLLISNLVYM